MSATAKNADLVDKITFLHNCIFTNDSPAFVETAAGKTQRYLNQKQTQIMRYILLLLAVPAVMATQCGEHKKKTAGDYKQKDITGQVNDAVPACIRRLIEEGNKETPPNAPLQVDEYLYNGKKVYLTTAPCCDQYNSLYDDSCRPLCAPSGGFSGRGDGKCPDFTKTAKFVKLIWKKTGN